MRLHGSPQSQLGTSTGHVDDWFQPEMELNWIKLNWIKCNLMLMPMRIMLIKREYQRGHSLFKRNVLTFLFPAPALLLQSPLPQSLPRRDRAGRDGTVTVWAASDHDDDVTSKRRRRILNTTVNYAANNGNVAAVTIAWAAGQQSVREGGEDDRGRSRTRFTFLFSFVCSFIHSFLPSFLRPSVHSFIHWPLIIFLLIEWQCQEDAMWRRGGGGGEEEEELIKVDER